MEGVVTERDEWPSSSSQHAAQWERNVHGSPSDRWGVANSGLVEQLRARRTTEPFYGARRATQRRDDYGLLIDQVRKARLLVSGIFLVLAALSFIPMFLDRDVQLTALLGFIIFLTGVLARFYVGYLGTGDSRWRTGSVSRRRTRTARGPVSGWRWRMALEAPPRHLLSPQELRYVQMMQRLSLIDRDFTPQDYELLLELDAGSAAMQQFLHGAPQDAIDLLPCYTYKEWLQHRSIGIVGDFSETKHSHEKESRQGGTESTTETAETVQPSSDTRERASALAITTADVASCDNCEPSSSGNVQDTVTESNLPDEAEAVCVVCLDLFQPDERIRVLPCLHQYHQQCIDPWLRQQARCPVCKSEIL